MNNAEITRIIDKLKNEATSGIINNYAYPMMAPYFSVLTYRSEIAKNIKVNNINYLVIPALRHGPIIMHILFNKKYNICDYIETGDGSYYIKYPGIGIHHIQLDPSNLVICVVSEHHTENFEDEFILYKLYYIGTHASVWREKINARLYKMYQKNYNQEYNKNIEIIKKPFCNNSTIIRTAAKSMQNIIMPKNKKDNMLNDINRFIKNQKFYNSNNIKYTFGIFLYGLPGTGKSAFVYALAKLLNVSILAVTSEDITHYNGSKSTSFMFDNYNTKSWHSIKNIILIEEFDSVISATVSSTDSVGGGKIRKDQVIDFIDGIPENTILIATSNIDISQESSKDIIDPSLIRSGRFDIKCKMEPFNKEEMCRMISKYTDLDEEFIHRYDEYDTINPTELQYDITQYLCDKIIRSESDGNDSNNTI